MRRRMGMLVATACLCAASPALARDDAQVWTTASATADLGGSFRLSQEIVTRISDVRGGLYEFEANILFGYRLSERVTVWAGYTHDPNYAGGDFTVMEHRGREQITIDRLARLGPATFSARVRLEQRWREGATGTGWRLRPYVKAVVPVRPGARTALVLSHESFVNLNTTAFQAVGGHDRTRDLVAISLPVARRLNAEVGYLLQHGFVPRGDDTDDHVASLSLSLSF